MVHSSSLAKIQVVFYSITFAWYSEWAFKRMRRLCFLFSPFSIICYLWNRLNIQLMLIATIHHVSAHWRMRGI